MPYVIKHNDDQWCVYKEGDNGESMGETLGCHPSESEAKDHLAALYANVEESVPEEARKMNLLERLWHKLSEIFKGQPKQPIAQSLSLSTAMMDAMMLLGEDAYVIDVYLVADQVAVLYNSGGKLYTVAISEAPDGTVMLGEPLEVIITTQSNKVNITRQADGHYRWFALAACSVVNKQGEIDSRELFDDFVNRFDKGQGFVLRFFHDKRMELGVGDYLARSDNVLVASGLIYDNELGRAFVDACQQSRGNWGTSPGFYPDAEPEIMRTADGIEVPVYTRGYLEEISALPESCACNFFTRLIANVKERSMDTRTREALVTLFGDEAKADEFISKVDETNRAIADGGLLTRETTTEQTEATTTEQVTETPPETAIIPDKPIDMPATSDTVLTRLGTLENLANEALSLHRERMDAFEAGLTGMKQAYENRLAELKQAVDALKLTDEEKQRTWLADRPPSATQPVTYRPREDRRSNPEGTKPSFADIAAGTLARMPK